MSAGLSNLGPRPRRAQTGPAARPFESTAGARPEPQRSGRATESISPLRKAALLVISLEETLARQLLSQLGRADIDALNQELSRLEQIDAREQQLALEEFLILGLKRLRFVFEDVVRMDDVGIRQAFLAEHVSTWALALGGASRPARMKVLQALPPSASDGLRRALAGLGQFRLDDVESAQSELAERFRSLHDEGLIVLPEPDGQEDVLV